MTLLRRRFLAAAFAVVALSGFSTAQAEETMLGQIKLENPWSREMPATSEVAGGFVTITNTGTADDKLIKASSDISDVTQIHEMVMEGDTMKMKEVDGGLVIPAGKTVVLKPKSYHLMFMKLKAHPKTGESFKATLTFEKAGSTELTFKVEAPGTMH